MYLSPCKGTCNLSMNQICQGCGRTILEIRNWKDYSNDQKIEIMERFGHKVKNANSR